MSKFRGCPFCGEVPVVDLREPQEVSCQECYVFMSDTSNKIDVLSKKWDKRSRGYLDPIDPILNPFVNKL